MGVSYDPTMLRVRILLFGMLALARAVAAQTPTGSIDGVIVDTSGGVVPGVTVVLTHEPTGVAREVVSDAQGLFRAPLLPVGPYTVKAALPGFQPFENAGSRPDDRSGGVRPHRAEAGRRRGIGDRPRAD